MSLLNKLFGKKDNPQKLSSTESTALPQTQANKINVNKPLENPRLKALFEQWHQQRTDELLHQILEEIMMSARFLFVVRLSEEPTPSGDGTVTLREGTTIEFPMLTSQDEKNFYPAFIDWGELAKWKIPTLPPKTFILSFNNFLTMVLQRDDIDGVVIKSGRGCALPLFVLNILLYNIIF